MKLSEIEQDIDQIKIWLTDTLSECENDSDKKVITFLRDEATKFSIPLAFNLEIGHPGETEQRYGTFFNGTPITTDDFPWPYDHKNEPMSPIVQFDFYDFFKYKKKYIKDKELSKWLSSIKGRTGGRYLQVWQSNTKIDECCIRLVPFVTKNKLYTEYDFSDKQKEALSTYNSSLFEGKKFFQARRLYPYPTGYGSYSDDQYKLIGIPLIAGRQFVSDYDDLLDALLVRGFTEDLITGVLKKIRRKVNKLSKIKHPSGPDSYYFGAYKPSHGLSDALDYYLDYKGGGWKCLFSVDCYEDPLMIMPRHSLLYRFKNQEEPEFEFVSA